VEIKQIPMVLCGWTGKRFQRNFKKKSEGRARSLSEGNLLAGQDTHHFYWKYIIQKLWKPKDTKKQKQNCYDTMVSVGRLSSNLINYPGIKGGGEKWTNKQTNKHTTSFAKQLGILMSSSLRFLCPLVQEQCTEKSPAIQDWTSRTHDSETPFWGWNQ
jgi:hypothetical protein